MPLTCEQTATIAPSDKRMSLYVAGLSDQAMARAEGVHRTSIKEWRQRRGLTANGANVVLTVEEQQQRRALYDEGLNDNEIARIVGVAPKSVAAWRHRKDLPANAHSLNHSPEQRAARLFLYGFGYTDAQIAREQRIGAKTVWHWRRRLGLPRHPHRYRARQTKARDLMARIKRAIGSSLARDVAEDAAADLYIAVIDGRISIDAIEKSARQFGNRVLGQFASQFGPRSLDEQIGDSEGFTLLDTMADEGQSDWLERMGATVW